MYRPLTFRPAPRPVRFDTGAARTRREAAERVDRWIAGIWALFSDGRLDASEAADLDGLLRGWQARIARRG